jgi:class 3 adenylate cyclase
LKNCSHIPLPLLFAILWALLFSGVSLEARSTFSETTDRIQLYPLSEILEVPLGSLKIEELSTDPQRFGFDSTEDFLMEMRSIDKGYWIRFEVLIETEKELAIYIPHSGTDLIEFYQIIAGEVVPKGRSGVLVPNSQQPLSSSHTIFPVDTEPGKLFVGYLYLEGPNLPGLPFYLSSSQHIIEKIHKEYLFDGLMFGMLVLIFIHNFLLYYQVREKDNLIYSGWVILVMIQFSIYKGHAVRFLWPEMVWINNYADIFFSLTAVTFLFFTLTFLKLRTMSPWLYRVGQGLVASYGILVFLIILGVADRFYIYFNVGTLTLFQGTWAIIAGIQSLRSGFRPAAYFLAANLVLFVSIFIFFAYANGALPHNFATYNVMHFGFGGQIILFAVALSDKVNLLKKGKEKAEKQRIVLLEEKQQLIREQKDKLEEQVKVRTLELEEEKEKSDGLLRNILPDEVASELKQRGQTTARRFDSATILFSDFESFTSLSRQITPDALVAQLNDCFSAFDRIMGKHGIEKIKTIGDAYMAVGGIPIPNDTHAVDIIRAAVDMLDFLQQYNQQNLGTERLQFKARIGVHTGPVVAGVVGLKKFAYDVWGNSVNIAARLESGGEAGQINVSPTTYELIKDEFPCYHRGTFKIKGAGSIDMYYVDLPAHLTSK